MKQLILIIPSALVKNFNYNVAKKSITSYLGTRLIEECSENVPGMIVKEVLDSADKQAIEDIVFPKEDSGIVMFVEFDEDNEPQDSYLSVRAL